MTGYYLCRSNINTALPAGTHLAYVLGLSEEDGGNNVGAVERVSHRDGQDRHRVRRTYGPGHHARPGDVSEIILETLLSLKTRVFEV